HRIDQNTTGTLVICKNDIAHRALADQFAVHDITRKYRAICIGILPEDEYTIEGNIGRNPRDRKKMAVLSQGGKPAVTHVRVLERLSRGYSYVECTLETGRTHQIRVHMAHIRHPVLGDDVYGPARSPVAHLNGQTLHAMTIGFIHPSTHEYVEFEAPMPDYFNELLNKLSR
ncbi:MAG TPA: RNA pseudouridine synthase, partial [Lachnospiraceae bacterium]|nr:RNA pseudouridine synthase [Lachnospiraceae bacterium]